jgi:hypothetical protein
VRLGYGGLHLTSGARAEPQSNHKFWQGFDASLAFLRQGPRTWSYRLKTFNLAQGFFRELRRVLGCFPGYVSPRHFDRTLGRCLAGADHA